MAAGLRVERDELTGALRAVGRLAEARDDAGRAVVAAATLARAAEWLRAWGAAVAETGGAWRGPQVAATPLGEVVFEWWHGGRSLTVYVTEAEVSYVFAWGKDIHREMEDGDASDPATIRRLWSALVG